MLNIINITGSKNEIVSLRHFVESEKHSFDFTKIMKQPEVLLNMALDKELSVTEEIELLSNHGAINIPEWRKLYWGTEYPCSNVSWYSNTFIKIQTKDNTPRKIFEKITRLFQVTMYIVYTDGKQAGIIKAEDGILYEQKATGIEAELLTYLCDNTNCTFDKWEKDENNKKAKFDKKIDMKILFNKETAFINNAKQIINDDVKELIF